MKAPSFWNFGKKTLRARLLSPIGALYHQATTRRANQQARWKAPVPVLCIGNITMGGAGKTPTALAIAHYLMEAGKSPIFLSRGYGGRLAGPVMVEDHTAVGVGDEPLLLKQLAPVCVSADRVAGAKMCVEQGADVIIMDDGYQNPHLYKDVSILVVDGGFGHGNEKVFPAGPLREKLTTGLARAQGLILIGEDKTGSLARIGNIRPDLPLIKAEIQVDPRDDLKGKKLLAFAGIGRPEKFFETLRSLGAELCEEVGFADHHPYSNEEINALKERAKNQGASLITTQKDRMRLPENMKKDIDWIKISLVWQGLDVLKPVLSPLLGKE
ncbi:Tetraacyldisaccharide 4'-kinase [Candidatus Terasakiella magnetica]|uniref:Tetraacyldisaccharide 4'-kinase n=1 Tax=Candidatus Terasakiella magnetica TaxID=1867952 RepID=A0A1C3RF25_9PROT|nr:tetraacyldisaccharide 4'-kinase [Candidatus Terasakiella magnetica]SCA55855.1 Tetraacyldisaccharide 4'-kinase [Candidatus Terasakiella magnetica]